MNWPWHRSTDLSHAEMLADIRSSALDMQETCDGWKSLFEGSQRGWQKYEAKLLLRIKELEERK